MVPRETSNKQLALGLHQCVYVCFYNYTLLVDPLWGKEGYLLKLFVSVTLYHYKKISVIVRYRVSAFILIKFHLSYYSLIIWDVNIFVFYLIFCNTVGLVQHIFIQISLTFPIMRFWSSSFVLVTRLWPLQHVYCHHHVQW